LSLDHLLKNSRILMSAVAHEVRNLCGAVLVVQKNLSGSELQQQRLSGLEHADSSLRKYQQWVTSFSTQNAGAVG
jgi:hypothetical protein